MLPVFFKLLMRARNNLAVLIFLVFLAVLALAPLEPVNPWPSSIDFPNKSSPRSKSEYGRSVYSKRTAEDKDWPKCLDTGEKLLGAINCQQPDSPTFDSFEQLEQDGWEFQLPPDSLIDGDLAPSSTTLQLSRDGWKRWVLDHNSWKDVNGNSCKMTIDTNVKDGAIVVTRSYGPKEPQQGKLTRLSDIAFLLLRKHAEKANTALKFNYYIVMSVSNSATKSRIRDIMGKLTVEQKLKTAERGPGLVFKSTGPKNRPGSNEPDEGTFARVLLGSPTGIASGWILVNRQHVFPGRTLKSVGIFQSDYDEDEDNNKLELFDMVYTIGDSN